MALDFLVLLMGFQISLRFFCCDVRSMKANPTKYQYSKNEFSQLGRYFKISHYLQLVAQWHKAFPLVLLMSFQISLGTLCCDVRSMRTEVTKLLDKKF